MGQYTGNVTLTPIAAKENNTGLQAWVKRDMFQNLKPVGDGFGAEMLRRLGWKEGEPLGKSGIGRVEPVADEVKLDRKCEHIVQVAPFETSGAAVIAGMSTVCLLICQWTIAGCNQSYQHMHWLMFEMGALWNLMLTIHREKLPDCLVLYTSYSSVSPCTQRYC